MSGNVFRNITKEIVKYCNNLRQISCDLNELNIEFIVKFGHKLKSIKMNDEFNDWRRLKAIVEIQDLDLQSFGFHDFDQISSLEFKRLKN